MPASMSSVTTRGFGIAGGFTGDAGLVVTLGYGLGEAVEDVIPDYGVCLHGRDHRTVTLTGSNGRTVTLAGRDFRTVTLPGSQSGPC